MGRKPKYTAEQKIQASLDYLGGKKSASEIAESLGMGKRGCETIRRWAKAYGMNGPSIFDSAAGNRSYAKEFKEAVASEYLSGKYSLVELSARYGIPSNSTVLAWARKYNSYMELRDYVPMREVYMAASRKTTKEERLEIVKYCIGHGRNYKDAAARYHCSYAQVYRWTRKYESEGEAGLDDRRGKRKREEELNELEKARRRISILEKENEKLRMEAELLKKAEALERKPQAIFREPNGHTSKNGTGQ